jgi:murein DD-endopeptidase MepM/ murein hydrolase activator NlpD
MLRKRYYIVFVSRDDDGRVRKIPLPVQYVYGFIAIALVGTFTIVGLAGSYTRMLLKTESFNQIRQERETLRTKYQQMAQIAHERDVQVASLGALASEVTAIYGLKQDKLNSDKLNSGSKHAAAAAATPASLNQDQSLALTDDVDQQNVKMSLDQFYTLRTQALSGRVSRALEGGLTPGISSGLADWTQMADAPSIWPVEGKVSSGFGQRGDPFKDEGEFHAGLDILAPTGTPIRAAGDGMVEFSGMQSGYGREIILDHGHGLRTVYGHMSALVATGGEHVLRGQVIGYVGQSGRATCPHLHYEVRINKVPVNPNKYLRSTFEEVASNDLSAAVTDFKHGKKK